MAEETYEVRRLRSTLWRVLLRRKAHDHWDPAAVQSARKVRGRAETYGPNETEAFEETHIRRHELG